MIPNEHDLRVEVLTQACTAPYAAVIDIPGEAPAADRLVGFLGRDPSWSSGQ